MLCANRVIISMYTPGRLRRKASRPGADRHSGPAHRHSNTNSHRYVHSLTDEHAHEYRNPDGDPGTHDHFRIIANS
jgi:hypothetical protein